MRQTHGSSEIHFGKKKLHSRRAELKVAKVNPCKEGTTNGRREEEAPVVS